MFYSLEDIGKNLRQLRIKRNWKYIYISKNTDITVDRLKRLELGDGIITHNELYRLSRLYDVTIDELVFQKL